MRLAGLRSAAKGGVCGVVTPGMSYEKYPYSPHQKNTSKKNNKMYFQLRYFMFFQQLLMYLKSFISFH